VLARQKLFEIFKGGQQAGFMRALLHSTGLHCLKSQRAVQHCTNNFFCGPAGPQIKLSVQDCGRQRAGLKACTADIKFQKLKKINSLFFLSILFFFNFDLNYQWSVLFLIFIFLILYQ
jgi:hypothetical protein